ncbi:MAG: UDP-N-acetylmuramate--L-alanine ligase [Ornithinimicrobium sp.]
MTEQAAARAPRFDFHTEVAPAADLGHVHFVAIGGAGVSSVAAAFLQAGHEVSGSDQRDSATLEALREAGARVFVGHDASHIAGADTLIISGAVPESNLEVVAARRAGIPVLHRAQGIAALGAHRDVVAVAGANGKTTTSAMLVAALDAAHQDPGYVIGSPLVQSGRSAALGSGPVVVEADESDGSFVAYRPRVAVITNVMADHLDFYGDFAGVKSAYRAFVDSISAGGVAVLNADDDGARELTAYAALRHTTLTCGQSTDADVRLTEVEHGAGKVSGLLIWPSGRSTTLSVPMPGLHNLANAAAAVVAAVQGFNLSPDLAASGLAVFGGTRRRFELVGEVDGVRVIDDYAHNPAKVAAVVHAGRASASEGRVVVAFQPHLYSRTRDFATAFAAGLRHADVVMILDVYGAREQPIPGVGAHTILDLLDTPDAGGPELLPTMPMREAALALSQVMMPGDTLLTVGAGDVTTLGPLVLQALQERPPYG